MSNVAEQMVEQVVVASGVELVEIDIELISIMPGLNKRYDLGEIKELAESIGAVGVKVPLSVRPKSDGTGYELVAGHRRLEAAKLAGKKVVPCLVETMIDRDAVLMNGLENIGRKDLTPIEEAETLLAIAEALGRKGKLASGREVAKYVGKNNVTVTARLKLAQASDMLKSAVRNGKLDAGRADRLIKDGQDNPAAIAEAMAEHAIAKAKGQLARAETIANRGEVEPSVTQESVKNLTPENNSTAQDITPDSPMEGQAPEPQVEPQVETQVPQSTPEPVVVIPEPENTQPQFPLTSPSVEELPVAQTKVTIVPSKGEQASSESRKRDIKMVHLDTARCLLDCVTEVLRDCDPTSERYAFLQGVQWGYQVMCNIDTNPDVPEEWEVGL